jgi:large subunit ribosomal protein L13
VTRTPSPNPRTPPNLDKKSRFFVFYQFVSFYPETEICAMETFVPSGKNLEQSRKWYLIDANGKTVGRLASEAARMLMGKNKPTYTPFLDTGDHVVIINAEKVVFTGRKLQNKSYHHHTGWPGGLKSISADRQLQKHPERVLESAIRGMLPKTKLGRAMGKKLKVYAGTDHPHAAQRPQLIEL